MCYLVGHSIHRISYPGCSLTKQQHFDSVYARGGKLCGDPDQEKPALHVGLSCCYGLSLAPPLDWLLPFQINGETLEPPRPLLWYPDKLAWHMTFSREQLRNNPKLNEVTSVLLAPAHVMTGAGHAAEKPASHSSGHCGIAVNGTGACQTTCPVRTAV